MGERILINWEGHFELIKRLNWQIQMHVLTIHFNSKTKQKKTSFFHIHI